ncbi:hypothetical protein QPK13_09145 [Photorhabdus tasmaniensis]
MGHTELKNKLAAIVPDTDFKLDESSTLDILNWLQEYTKEIPFDQEKKQLWDSFYFIQENNPEKLADIYQNVNKADGHLPAHQTFVLAFLKLLETTKTLFNTFPARHRDLYYRELLGLKPRSSQADSVALSITLKTDNTEYFIPKGTLFDAGKDSAGNPLQYASDTDLLANQGKLTDLRWFRKDNDGWQSATPLNLSDNIKLPENGIKLFSPTPNDTPILSGYLITSPLFAMSKGERNIKVTLANEWMGNPNSITAQISSGKHWLSLLVKKENVNGINYLELCSSAKDAPITPPDNLDNMTFDVPVLKLSTTQGPILPKITGIEISINGNQNVRYASDSGIEQTNTTSFPFGQSPVLGSGFNLVAPEWYGSEGATLTLTPQWVGLPTENFSKWYEKYGPKPADNSAFNVQAYLATPQERIKLNEGNNIQPLFTQAPSCKNKQLNDLPQGQNTQAPPCQDKQPNDPPQGQNTQAPPCQDKQPNDPPQGQNLKFTLPAMNYPLVDSPKPNDWPASIRIELAGQDFLHSQYWQDPKDKNQAYTPKISALQVTFSVKAKTEQYSIYPLTPFGWTETEENIPSLTNDAFYLGFTDVLPGQTLSLYWQLESLKELPLSWFYLNQKNTWNPLDKLIHDQTRNLLDRGAWRTLLPPDASNQAPQMPKGRYWIKAQMAPIKLTNRGILTDLRWYRKDNNVWKSAIPLNLSNSIKLPENGIKLFSPTPNDTPVMFDYLITSSLFVKSKKKLNIKVTLGNKWAGNSDHITAKISSENEWISLLVEIKDNNLELNLSNGNKSISSSVTLDNITFNVPVLKLSITNGFTLPNITGITINSIEAKTTQYSIYPLTPFVWVDHIKDIPPLTHDTFYLGFTNVPSEQILSLWQLEDFEKFPLSWSYLSENNTWKPLDQPFHDKTLNPSNKVSWSILLPPDASNETSQMPIGRYWIKAQILPLDASNKTSQMPTGRYWIKAQMNEVKHYPQIKGLLYNATTATLINTETVEQNHLINKLAADSIKQPVNTSVAISKVTQPWASWNGRPKETEQAFLARVPARLSHRNRVLSWSDIVTLLKENFVSLFDVKYPSVSELTKVPAPKKRQLIVIPDNRYKDNDDKLRPELNQARLTEMVEWLDRLSSPWTTIEIKNPTYVDVQINYQLVFTSGVNPDYGRHQLQQELSRIYMPWGENITIGVTLGNRIDYYQLLATIQQSPLVERVTNLTLKKCNLTDSVDESIEADHDEVLILVWSLKETSSNQGVDK